MNTMETVNLNVIENDGFAKLNVVQPGNVAMAAEQVEVVQAYSPTVDLEELENGVTITVTDHRGTDSATVDLSETIDSFESYMAIYSRNLGDIEGTVEEVEETAQRVDAVADDLEAALTEIDNALEGTGLSRWSRLNRPNLLKQNWWTNSGDTDIIYGDASRYLGSDTPYMKSISHYTIYYTEPSAEAQAAADHVWHREAGTYSDGTTYPEAWYLYYDSQDGITTSPVTLTGDAIITEADGEVYDKAIQYNIVENSAWGNMETLYYPRGHRNYGYTQGKTLTPWGRINEMEVGKTYTVSCWARVTSGTAAWLKFGWGGTNTNVMGYPTEISGVSDKVEITGSAWKRISWTFVFNPTGTEYTETTEEVTPETGDPYTRVIRTYNWMKRVIIGVMRKYTATLQLCGFRLTEGGLYLPTKFDECESKIAALTRRVEELEAIVIENQGS